MPLLRVYERNADGTPPLSEGETVLFRSPATEMYLGEDLQGKGEVFVTSRNVIWLDATKADLGYSMDYPYIVMHAVSRDTSAFPKACLYCHLDTSDDSVSELRFAPDDESTCTCFSSLTLFVLFCFLSVLWFALYSCLKCLGSHFFSFPSSSSILPFLSVFSAWPSFSYCDKLLLSLLLLLQ